MKEYIKESVSNSIALKEALLSCPSTLATIESIGAAIAALLKSGGKVLLCGNGGSASDAQHIAAEFVGRFVESRRALPAIALTTDTSILTAVANDFGFEQIFARQVEALGGQGDMLIGFSTSGNSENVVRALKAARERKMITVGLLGGDGGDCLELCDLSVVVGSKEAARVQEIHILIGHIICGMAEKLVCNNA